MGEIKVDVFRNDDAEDYDLDDAYDAVVHACDQISDATGLGYEVRKRGHTFSIDSRQGTIDILDDFENDLAYNFLYDTSYPRCYLLVFEDGSSGYKGRARYETGDPGDDDRRDYLDAGNRYGLAVADHETAADRNVAIHETLHTFMEWGDGYDSGEWLSDHEKGGIYPTDEVSPMSTGHASDASCRDDGSATYYVDTLTTCTKDGVDYYMDNTWSAL